MVRWSGNNQQLARCPQLSTGDWSDCDQSFNNHTILPSCFRPETIKLVSIATGPDTKQPEKKSESADTKQPEKKSESADTKQPEKKSVADEKPSPSQTKTSTQPSDIVVATPTPEVAAETIETDVSANGKVGPDEGQTAVSQGSEVEGCGRGTATAVEPARNPTSTPCRQDNQRSTSAYLAAQPHPGTLSDAPGKPASAVVPPALAEAPAQGQPLLPGHQGDKPVLDFPPITTEILKALEAAVHQHRLIRQTQTQNQAQDKIQNQAHGEQDKPLPPSSAGQKSTDAGPTSKSAPADTNHPQPEKKSVSDKKPLPSPTKNGSSDSRKAQSPTRRAQCGGEAAPKRRSSSRHSRGAPASSEGEHPPTSRRGNSSGSSSAPRRRRRDPSPPPRRGGRAEDAEQG